MTQTVSNFSAPTKPENSTQESTRYFGKTQSQSEGIVNHRVDADHVVRDTTHPGDPKSCRPLPSTPRDWMDPTATKSIKSYLVTFWPIFEIHFSNFVFFIKGRGGIGLKDRALGASGGRFAESCECGWLFPFGRWRRECRRE